MIKFERETGQGELIISSYNADSVVVDNKRLTNSFIITPEAVHAWSATGVDTLSAEQLQALIDLKPDLILLGTGTQQIFPDTAQLQLIQQANIGLEVMNNAAACRTYNVLANEGRAVVCGMILTNTAS